MNWPLVVYLLGIVIGFIALGFLRNGKSTGDGLGDFADVAIVLLWPMTIPVMMAIYVADWLYGIGARIRRKAAIGAKGE